MNKNYPLVGLNSVPHIPQRPVVISVPPKPRPAPTPQTPGV